MYRECLFSPTAFEKKGLARSAGADNMYLHFIFSAFYGLYISFSTISYMLFPAFDSK